MQYIDKSQLFILFRYSNLTPSLPPWRGALYASPSLVFFCLLLKIFGGNPFLKILDLANLFVANAPMKKEEKKDLSHSKHLKYRSNGREG